MQPIRQILVPTDFGRAAERAAALAIEMAKPLGARVTLMHAYFLPVYTYGVVPTGEMTKMEEAARRSLEATARRLERRGTKVDTLLRHVSEPESILDVAAEIHADLIVMGTHGRRGLPHAVLGSVAERTVRLSPIPVLTVPQWSFIDRKDAGKRLGDAVARFRDEMPVVVVLDRGSVPVGVEVANSLGSPIDVLAVETLRIPSVAEVGAVAEEGEALVDADVFTAARASSRQIDSIARAARRAAHDHVRKLRGERPIANVRDRTVIIACDAATTTFPIAVAARALRELGARKLIAAVPLCSEEVKAGLELEVDELVCLEVADTPVAPMQIYRKSSRPTDRGAAGLLAGAAATSPGEPHGRSANLSR